MDELTLTPIDCACGCYLSLCRSPLRKSRLPVKKSMSRSNELGCGFIFVNYGVNASFTSAGFHFFRKEREQNYQYRRQLFKNVRRRVQAVHSRHCEVQYN